MDIIVLLEEITMSFESFEKSLCLIPTLNTKPKQLTNSISTLLSIGLIGGVLTLSACSQPSKSSQQTQQTPAPASTSQAAPVATASTPASATASSTVTTASVASATATTTVSNVSQQFTGNSDIEKRLKQALPEITYRVDNLSPQAVATNDASFGSKPAATDTTTLASAPAKEAQSSNSSTTSAMQTTSANTANGKVNKQQALYTKIQALLNWHQFGVGAVDGKWGKNTVKAMQAFQQAHNLPVTTTMNEQTWQALSDNPQLNTQPVLVNYTLTDADDNQTLVKIPSSSTDKAKLDTMGYERMTEALAEKFHIDEQYLKALNPKATYQVGETITVYNPGQPNLTAVARVVADKTKQQLFAYDEQDNLIAVYPTTVGSSETPSPTGTHEVKNRVLKPNYTHTSKDKKEKDIIQPGPNNPVGLVWIGLDKEGYGIHGSPDPEAISRQASQGCVRLTNWDALALYGTIKDAAKVEFK